MDQNSMESLNIILDDLQDMQLSIDLFEINSDANAPTFPLPHKINRLKAVSYTHLRAHETREDLGCRGGG